MAQDILQQILSSPRLPTVPVVALRLVEMCRDPNVDINQVVEVLSRDAAMTAKVLRTANSAAWSPGKPITTLKQAVVMLGLRNTKVLALGFCLTSGVTDRLGDSFDLYSFWRRSLYAAAAAQVIAKYLKAANPEEVFTAGLLQDLGVLAMACTLGDPYLQAYKAAGGWHAALARCEREYFKVDHAQVGAALARHWNLPSLLVEAIANHEEDMIVPSPYAAVLRAVASSGIAADVFLVRNQQSLARYWDVCRLRIGASRPEASRLLREIASEAKELESLFGTHNGPPVNAEQVLAVVNEMLVQMELETRRRALELENKTQQLLAQSQTDPLTGLANRRMLDEFLDTQFALCASRNKPLSVILADVDHFKEINDTFGHPAGDEVLRSVGEVLARQVPSNGLAARYGGEEFVLVLPDLTIAAATRLAEQIRQAINQIRIAVSDHRQVSVSVSMGVAAMDTVNFPTPARLLAAADRALYAAKAAGRNCVRVLVPRPSTTSTTTAA